MREIEQAKYVSKYIEVLTASLNDRNAAILQLQTTIAIYEEMLSQKEATIVDLENKIDTLISKVDETTEKKE